MVWCRGTVKEKIFDPWRDLLRSNDCQFVDSVNVTDFVVNKETGCISKVVCGDEIYNADAVILAVGISKLQHLVRNSCLADLQEVLAQQKAQAPSSINEEVDLDELMDDPELEKLHADQIAALKKEVEKREALKNKGQGEYREISEGDFLGEVTGSEKVICHFYHSEFYRCKIMDKHLKALASRHFDAKFIKQFIC